eukprot:465245-Rhodomonas_salina.1
MGRKERTVDGELKRGAPAVDEQHADREREEREPHQDPLAAKVVIFRAKRGRQCSFNLGDKLYRERVSQFD